MLDHGRRCVLDRINLLDPLLGNLQSPCPEANIRRKGSFVVVMVICNPKDQAIQMSALHLLLLLLCNRRKCKSDGRTKEELLLKTTIS